MKKAFFLFGICFVADRASASITGEVFQGRSKIIPAAFSLELW